MAFKDQVVNATRLFEAEVASVLGPQVGHGPWCDPKLWLGLTLWGSVWAVWFCRPEDRAHTVADWRLTAVLVLGGNLFALAMQETGAGTGVLGVLALCALNAVLTRLLWEDRTPVLLERGEGAWVTGCIYEDLTASMWQVGAIFFAQVTLMAFLLYASFVASSSFTYSFWLCAFICVQMTAFFKRGVDSQLGRTWNLERARGMLEEATAGLEYARQEMNDTGEREEVWDRLPVAVWQCRDVMGSLVNTYFRDVVAFITPLVLMQSDSAMEFVQNALAVSFITTLDDVSEKEIPIRRKRDLTGLRDALI